MNKPRGEAALGRMLQALSSESSDLIGQVIAAAKDHLGADVSFLTEFKDGRKLIRRASGVGASEGDSFPLDGTYCYRVATGTLPSLVRDARNDERVKDLAITRQLNIGSYIGVPVTLPGGEVYGTLCCLSTQADASLRDRDVMFMRVLADLVRQQLARDEQTTRARRRQADAIRSVIARRKIRMVYQPIVDLVSGAVVGAEALARFEAEPRRSPDLWFKEAWAAGLGVELEVAAVKAAVAGFRRLPADVYLSVNVSPQTVQQGAFRDVIARLPRDRLVVEVTEHAMVDDYALLLESVGRLKKEGIRLAADDVGAGYSGLVHILRVAPHIVKLDLALTRGIHTDPAKQALATAVANFALRTHVALVAEGIETKEDADTLRIIGVRYGQGYYLGKPGPLPLRVPK